jgi:hypothetical protein
MVSNLNLKFLASSVYTLTVCVNLLILSAFGQQMCCLQTKLSRDVWVENLALLQTILKSAQGIKSCYLFDQYYIKIIIFISFCD